jgi:putative membrane protein
VLRGLADDRRDAVAALREADVPFLLALGVGVFGAVLTVVPVLGIGIDRVPALTFGFFFGLIAASVVVLRHVISLDGPRQVAAFVGGVVLAAVASGGGTAVLGTSLAGTAVAGALAVSAMLLPGISGSLILVILGQYKRMSTTLHEFQSAVFAYVTGGDATGLVETGTVVVAFVAGAVVGLFTVARGVRAALARDRETTLTFLVALVIGALRAPVVSAGSELDDLGRTWTPETVGLFVAAAVVGAVVVLALDRAVGGVEV